MPMGRADSIKHSMLVYKAGAAQFPVVQPTTVKVKFDSVLYDNVGFGLGSFFKETPLTIESDGTFVTCIFDASISVDSLAAAQMAIFGAPEIAFNGTYAAVVSAVGNTLILFPTVAPAAGFATVNPNTIVIEQLTGTFTDFTLPAGFSKMQVSAQVFWEYTIDPQWFSLGVQINGGDAIGFPADDRPALNNTANMCYQPAMSLSLIPINAGDLISVVCQHNCGTPNNTHISAGVNTFFYIELFR